MKRRYSGMTYHTPRFSPLSEYRYCNTKPEIIGDFHGYTPSSLGVRLGRVDPTSQCCPQGVAAIIPTGKETCQT
jgi:hypothetical protein